MHQLKTLSEEIMLNRTLERRNEELLKLLDAWQANSQTKKPKFIKSLNIHEVENLIIRYYQVYKIPVSLYDEEGKLLFSIGWKNICLKFHKNVHKELRNCKESVKVVNNQIADVDSFSFKCKNNVNSIAIPITVQDEILGTLVVNQFLYENEIPDNNKMNEIAYENGVDIEEFKKAFNELPLLSKAEVERMTEHYILFSEMISFIASYNVKLLDHQNISKEKKEICNVFKEKLDDQSYLIKSIYQFMLQQNQEIEVLKNELNALRRKVKVEYKEKSLIEENQPG